MTLAIKVDLNIKLENEDVKTQVGRSKERTEAQVCKAIYIRYISKLNYLAWTKLFANRGNLMKKKKLDATSNFNNSISILHLAKSMQDN